MKKNSMTTSFSLLPRVLVTGALLAFCITSIAFAEIKESHGLWTHLLQKHVENGAVDYLGFKKDEKELDKYLSFLDQTDPKTLQAQEQLALYINAYNSYTVKLILENFKDGQPVSSIKKLGGFFSGPWEIKFARIGGEIYTLDNIEHDIIRKQFREPRIHFAVNCASISCPPLISEAYEGHKLESQLYNNTVNFINDSSFNYLEGDTLHLSKIFSWFSEDFNDNVVGYVARYAVGTMKKKLDSMSTPPDVSFLQYDWSLNAKQSEAK